jgi:hypothetical protein
MALTIRDALSNEKKYNTLDKHFTDSENNSLHSDDFNDGNDLCVHDENNNVQDASGFQCVALICSEDMLNYGGQKKKKKVSQ